MKPCVASLRSITDRHGPDTVIGFRPDRAIGMTGLRSGEKTIETRTYPIPREYVGQEMIIIETPGKTGKFTARMVGLVTFGDSFEYKSETEFYQDSKRHCVTADSIWKWQRGQKRVGWPVLKGVAFKKPLAAPKKKGIKFTKNVTLE